MLAEAIVFLSSFESGKKNPIWNGDYDFLMTQIPTSLLPVEQG